MLTFERINFNSEAEPIGTTRLARLVTCHDLYNNVHESDLPVDGNRTWIFYENNLTKTARKYLLKVHSIKFPNTFCQFPFKKSRNILHSIDAIKHGMLEKEKKGVERGFILPKKSAQKAPRIL